MTREQRKTRGMRLGLESLEDRCLLSAGDLDPNFGIGGLVTTNLGTINAAIANSVAVYHNEGAVNEGKIVAAGYADNATRGGNNFDFAVVRYNANGSLDTTFGGSGNVTTAFGPDYDVAKAVVIQPDGKIVAAGITRNGGSTDFGVVRYNPSGSLDGSFGSKGKVSTNFTGNGQNRSDEGAEAVALQADGKIILAGECNLPGGIANSEAIALARYNANGSLDATFGSGGLVLTPYSAIPGSLGLTLVSDMALEPDGKVVVVGTTQVSGGYEAFTARYTVTGSLDTTFGGTGIVLVTLANSGDGALAIEGDGSIIAGWSNKLVHLNTNGSLDDGSANDSDPLDHFGTGGMAVLPIAANSLALQADGKIVFGGQIVARYLASGVPDTTFGINGDGTSATSPPPFSGGFDIAIQPDGRIVLAGTAANPQPNYNDFGLVRFLGDSRLTSAQAVTAGAAGGTDLTRPDAATRSWASTAYGQLPLSFEANRGQADPRVDFLSRGANYSLSLTPAKAVLSLYHGDTSNVISMRLVGASPTSHPVGLHKTSGVSNYLIGNNPSKWHTKIANYAKVGYRDVYRGINLVYHGGQQQLEYDFVVKPGADPRAIRMAFACPQGKSIDAHGNLVLHTSGGDLVQHAPVAYQTKNGVRHPVGSRFVLKHGGQVGFRVGRYEHDRALVIDPVLSYSTYLGGIGDGGYAIAVDAAGNAYVTGNHQNAGSSEVFVTKLNATGTGIVYSTYLGGNGADAGTGIALFTDPANNTFAYVTGFTDSTNFPTKNGVQTKIGGGRDAFVTKLSANGSALVYSSYLGGSGSERYTNGEPSGGFAVDSAGNAYVTGYTESTNFPVTPGAFQATFGGGQGDAFVTKINPSQVGNASLVYSTYLGGNHTDVGYGIAVDSGGDAYVTGSSFSTNFPVTPGAFQVTENGNLDAFVTKFSATGSGLVYSTLLGGTDTIFSDDTVAFGIAVNNSGNAYVTGYTNGSDFPTTLGAYQRSFNASYYDEAFMTKLNLDGTALVYSTYLGGSGNDRGRGIAVDGSGNAYITGMTASTGSGPSDDFPVQNAFQPIFGGGYSDAFVAKLNPSLSGTASLVYSTYLGGSALDDGRGIAVDGNGNAYITGFTESTDFPIKNAFQPKFKKGNSGYSDPFVTKITAN